MRGRCTAGVREHLAGVQQVGQGGQQVWVCVARSVAVGQTFKAKQAQIGLHPSAIRLWLTWPTWMAAWLYWVCSSGSAGLLGSSFEPMKSLRPLPRRVEVTATGPTACKAEGRRRGQ